MAEGMKKDRAKFFAGFFKDFYGAGLVSSPVSQEVIDWSWNIAMQASLKATLDCAVAFATTDFRGDLASMTVPTLIIHGTADKTVPIDTSGREAAQAIPQAKLIEYDDSPTRRIRHRQGTVDQGSAGVSAQLNVEVDCS